MSLLQKLVYHLTIKPRLNKLKKLLPEAIIQPTGSRYVCDPPVMGTDIDFLVYSEVDVDSTLLVAGYAKTILQYPMDGDQFNAWRRNKENLIVTSSVKYAEGFHTATHICKTKNIRSKFARVLIHEALRGTWDDAILWDDKQLRDLLASFNGPYGHAIHQAYRAQHGLGRF